MPPKCAICDKTAYPLESISAVDKVYHKACFKCDVCKKTLNISSYCGYEGKVYCQLHVPKALATSVTDAVAMRQARSAPKRTAEGLGTVQKGEKNLDDLHQSRRLTPDPAVLSSSLAAAGNHNFDGSHHHHDVTGNGDSEDEHCCDGGVYDEDAYEQLYENME